MLIATKMLKYVNVTPFTVNIVILSTESISVTFSMQLQTSMSHCKLPTNGHLHALTYSNALANAKRRLIG